MEKERLLALLRSILSSLGGYILGREVFGSQITETLWLEILGVVMGLASVVMSILAKQLTIEMVQGTVRQVLSFIGGVLVSKGVMSAETLTLILGLVPAILAWFQGLLVRRKNIQLMHGTISTNSLSK